MIHRSFSIKPGYDCRVTCSHERKGDHGIHCTEWVYTVVDRDAHIALELDVYTPFYPVSVQPRQYLHNIIDQKPFHGAYLRWHYGYAINRTQVLAGPDTERCKLIGRCWPDGSGIAADELVKLHFERNTEDGWPKDSKQLSEQPTLWAALEQKLKERLSDLGQDRREDGDLKWAVCEHCKGTGTIEQ